MRRLLVLAGAAVTVLGLVAGCSADQGGSDSGKTTLSVAALEGGYGRDMYNQVIQAYKTSHPTSTCNCRSRRASRTRSPRT
jgi:N-acetylglucosamine transport system substrate-binding protein